MAISANTEAFIPFRRRELIDLCIKENKLKPGQQELFHNFCELLSAFFHFKYQQELETAKSVYLPINPDKESLGQYQLNQSDRVALGKQLSETVEELLDAANYQKFLPADLDHALTKESIVPLKTKVDFNDFNQVSVFYRGAKDSTLNQRKWFRNHSIPIKNLSRVVLLLAFKDETYFQAKKKQSLAKELGFAPGKTYLFLYKNVPRCDIELLFPNVEVAMSFKDRLLFSLPAIGAIVPLIGKILPSLALLGAAIVLVFLGTDALQSFGISKAPPDNLFPVLSAALTVGIGLGGFAVKQYLNYKNKRLKFLKEVTDTLFFKCLVTNEGVIHSIVDATEEEVCKEIILIYYHLLISDGGMTAKQLDSRIESWLNGKFSAQIDFDIEKGLTQLSALSAPIGSTEGSNPSFLVNCNTESELSVLPLEDALKVVDYLWDAAFPYAQKATD